MCRVVNTPGTAADYYAACRRQARGKTAGDLFAIRGSATGTDNAEDGNSTKLRQRPFTVQHQRR